MVGIRTNYSSDGRDRFDMAVGKSFTTPLWHWYLYLPEWRPIPNRWRPKVLNATKKLLGKSVRVPHGVSFCRSRSMPPRPWKDCSPTSRQRQIRHFLALKPAPADDPVWWLQLAHAFESPFALRVHLRSNDEMIVHIALTKENTPLAYAERRLDFRGKKAWHHRLVVSEKWKKTGTATQLLVNAVAMYRKLGFESVRLTAGLTGGGATWPKMGFTPVDENAWEAVKSVVRENLERLDWGLSEAYKKAHDVPLASAVENAFLDIRAVGIYGIVDIDPDNKAADACGLKDGFAARLLAGGRFELELGLTDDSIDSFVSYVDKKHSEGKIVIPADWGWLRL